MTKKITVVAVVALALAAVILASMLFTGITQEEKISRFTYSLSAANKTYTVIVDANWDQENPPTVTLSNGTRHALILYFLGGTKKTLTYNISFPDELIGGNISLVKKYYLQDPDSYTLRSDGVYNSLEMTFDYNPPFSGTGYFEIIGTAGVKGP